MDFVFVVDDGDDDDDGVAVVVGQGSFVMLQLFLLVINVSQQLMLLLMKKTNPHKFENVMMIGLNVMLLQTLHYSTQHFEEDDLSHCKLLMMNRVCLKSSKMNGSCLSYLGKSFSFMLA